MDFSEYLNDYMEKVHCSAKELSEATGLSPVVISRYRNGEREPIWNSEQLERLIHGMEMLAAKKQITDISAGEISRELEAILRQGETDQKKLSENLNILMSALEINTTDLAKYLNYDASYLSRIRNGKRRLSDPQMFVQNVSRFIIRRYDEENIRSVLKQFRGKEEIPADSGSLQSELEEWFFSGKNRKTDYAGSFLHKLDEFNLDEFIRAIHFNDLKVPSVPFQFPASRNYYGLEEMKHGELDFFKATVLFKSKETVFMYGDMPMEDMADDLEFEKKWMFGIAVMLKKGLHLNIIHNLNRPFGELMLGLEGWIPIYMTGQITPYYFRHTQNQIYSHLDYSSGAAALAGECIVGAHSEGKYYFTNNRDEVAYYRRKAKRLLAKAVPLMQIYRKEKQQEYDEILSADAKTDGARKNVLSALPLYTMPEILLENILRRNNIRQDEQKKIFEYAKRQREWASVILAHDSMEDEVPDLSREEFEKYPMALSLSGIFVEQDIHYTYEEYREHLNMTVKYQAEHPGYSVRPTTSHAFRNIQIMIHEGKQVIVSKNKVPTIHFVIHQPMLCRAIENMIVPVVEPEKKLSEE